MRIGNMLSRNTLGYACIGMGLCLPTQAVALEPNAVVSFSYPVGTLLRNGSFEIAYNASAFEGWTFDPDGMVSAGGVLPVPVGTSILPNAGARAVALDYKVVLAGSRAMVSDAFPVKPNTWYTFFLKVRTANYSPQNENQKFRPVFQTFLSRDIKVQTEEETMIDNFRYGSTYGAVDAWSPYFHRFKTGPDARFATIALVTGASAGMSGRMFFDDAFLAQGCVRINLEDPLTGCPSDDAIAFGTDARHPDFAPNSRSFFNGMETVIQSSTQDGDRDIVTAILHDELGRPAKSTLPIAADFGATRHGFIAGITGAFAPGDLLANFYNPSEPATTGGRKTFNPQLEYADIQATAPYPEAGGVPFSESRYEPSPLGRPIEAAQPGSAWKMGSGHTVRTLYSSVAEVADGVTLLSPAPAGGNFYVTETTFPSGNRAREFTDRAGRVVRKSIPMGSGPNPDWINTDYFYNARGDLEKIVPPAGEDGFRNVTTMQYDDLKRLIAETSGPTGTTVFMHDDLGRVRFSRTPNQLASGRISFTRYDDLGRPILSGEVLDEAGFFSPTMANKPEFPCTEGCTDPETAVAKAKVFIQTVDKYDSDEGQLSCADAAGQPSNSPSEGILFVTQSPSGSGTACSDDITTTYFHSRTELDGATGNARLFAIFDPAGPLEIEPPPGTEIDLSVGSLNFSLEGVSNTTTDGIAAKTLFDACKTQEISKAANSTGRLVKTLACNPELSQALGDSYRKRISTSFTYDKYGNVTETEDLNEYVIDAGLRKQVVRNEYDSGNRLRQRTVCGDFACTPALAHEERYVYDRLNRLSTVLDKAGGALLDNHYNFLGQLTSRGLGGYSSSTQGSSLVQSTKYHLHGLPLELETRKAGVTSILFREQLRYENGTLPRYDGLISGASYTYDGSSTSQNSLDYSYDYDDLSRLSVALALPASGIASNVYDYLNDGRIGSMQKGVKLGNYFYNEKGQLDHVQGNLVENRNLNLPNEAGYVFKYDANGNMVKDYSKAVGGAPLDVQYRADNMPFEFGYLIPGSGLESFRTAKEYTAYDSRGSRAAKIDFVDGGFARSKSYYPSGSEIREELHGTPLQFFPLAGGGRIDYSVSLPQGSKEFYILDHLGSVRESYPMTTGSLSFATHYHPYGDQFAEFKTQGVEPLTPTYTGKEKDEETRLQYFGARYFDPELAVWTSPDPEAQFANLYGTSGDPVNFMDPDGTTEYRVLNGDGTTNTTLTSYVDDGSGDIRLVPNFMENQESGPGFWESLIPIWGSGRSAYSNFSEGHGVKGSLWGAAAVSDFFLLKALAVGAGRAAAGTAWKAAGSNSWRATRAWIGREGLAESGQQVHHWLLYRNMGVGKYFPEWFKNQPWNLMNMPSAAFHTALHGGGANAMGLAGRFYYGTPMWFKAVGMYGTSRSAGLLGN